MNTSKIDPSKLLGFKLTVAEEAANAVIGIKSGDKMGGKEGKSGLKAGAKAGTKAGGKLLKAGVMQGKVSLRPV